MAQIKQRGVIELGKSLLMVVLGLALLFIPEVTLVSLARLVAIFLIVQGIFVALSAFRYRRADINKYAFGLEAGVSLIVGFIILYNPGTTISFFVVVLAIWAILGGLLMAFSFNQLRKAGVTSWFLFFNSLVAMTFGLVLIFEPLRGGFALASIIGAFVLLHGLLSLFSAFSR
ncbi:HdeD family acid-resistance protein [Mangrovibacterium diazotrophicum]|uniref:Uncharacterized membrane protein HdeD (DUF308 family) n=1 Tax=Mangrovibacterium diazotrophicum TaxID=1261403 RepID=A0A419VVH6_9BACT|nr:DUF308 domain-containing protein [Mangrovibacterium diazotrophicum]RKD86157.1 uncharacterized membrane protein HdeD (DUF308 family) [Mangrovibacterium diazotrophicum]